MSMSKFSTTVCSQAPKTRQYRADIGPLEMQFESVQLRSNDLKKAHKRQQEDSQYKCKDDHTKMLLALLGEAATYHRTNTKQHVCKISRVRCAPTSSRPAGLSPATMKALVTDIDIVMNDDDKDNYQHALGAIAALSLWD